MSMPSRIKACNLLKYKEKTINKKFKKKGDLLQVCNNFLMKTTRLLLTAWKNEVNEIAKMKINKPTLTQPGYFRVGKEKVYLRMTLDDTPI